MLEPVHGLLVETLNPGLDMTLIAIALSAAAQRYTLNEGLSRPFLKMTRMIDRQLKEGVGDLGDFAKIHFKKTPIRLVREHDAVPLVFIKHVLEGEQPWLAPSRLGSAVREVNHWQVHVQFESLKEAVGREDRIGAAFGTFLCQFFN